MAKNTIAIVSGYFDPLHIGHINLMKEADKKYGSLYVIVNNSIQALNKKLYEFMPAQERLEIIQELWFVDYACLSIDEDRTVIKTLELIASKNNNFDKLVFCNGGDRPKGTIPEEEICNKLGIELVYGIGGDTKQQASSNLLDKFYNRKSILKNDKF